MSRLLSLNARLAHDADSSAETEVALLLIEHPLLSAPIRLSTDNAERISDDPLMYGTRSAWRGANPATEPWLWIVASFVVPDDKDDAPSSAHLVIENLDSQIAELLRSFTDFATLHVAVVLASTPDLIEGEFLNLKIMVADINATAVTLTISREEEEQELFPGGRMARLYFPGLHS